MTRYPLEPLIRLTGWSMNEIRRVSPCNGSELAVRQDRGVTELVADRLAIEAGYHPFEVWPEMVEAGIDYKNCDECGDTFDPVRSDQRFCGRTCRRRDADRRYKRKLRATPEGAEAHRTARRRFYAECAEYEKARERRRYHATKGAP